MIPLPPDPAGRPSSARRVLVRFGRQCSGDESRSPGTLGARLLVGALALGLVAGAAKLGKSMMEDYWQEQTLQALAHSAPAPTRTRSLLTATPPLVTAAPVAPAAVAPLPPAAELQRSATPAGWSVRLPWTLAYTGLPVRQEPALAWATVTTPFAPMLRAAPAAPIASAVPPEFARRSVPTRPAGPASEPAASSADPALPAPPLLPAGGSPGAMGTGIAGTVSLTSPTATLVSASTTPVRVDRAFATRSMTLPDAILAPHVAGGPTSTWTGAGANSSWGTAANWSGGSVPSPTGSAANVVFSSTGAIQTTSQLEISYAINGLSFLAGAPAYRVGAASGAGAPLSLDTGGLTQNSANLQNLNVATNLTASWSATRPAALR